MDRIIGMTGIMFFVVLALVMFGPMTEEIQQAQTALVGVVGFGGLDQLLERIPLIYMIGVVASLPLFVAGWFLDI